MIVSPGMVAGRYRVESLIGVGGTSTVWSVRHTLLGSRYALKILRRKRASSRKRILQEGRVQAHLAHPFILPVFDVIEISGYPALLMPYIDGPSLHQLLRAYTPTRDESLALLRCITEGLWYAHQHNLVHRDLKPANVLLDLRHGRLRPRIADFGLVKVGEDATTQPGAMLGTPAYAAPEQLFDADSANARADLFSLGVMFVELLTRHRPSSGTQPPSWSLDEVEDEGLRALIAALLQPDPRHRPASCQAVLEQLGAVPRKALLAGSRLVQAVERSRSRRSAEQQTAQSELSGTNAPETLPNNVPRRHNEFLGRDKELNTLQRQLTEGHRLITILGAGGVGKSRLSVELGRRLLGGPDEWPGGIWFIELAEIRAVHGIITAVAGALGIKLGTDPEAQLLRALVARPKTLLILDNFEQISQFAPQTVGRWLDQAENTQFLITSREPLRLRGERSHTVDVLDEADAIALFHVRAERVAPGFNLDSDHRDSVRALVHLLDRLPLAIELAAGRSPGFSPEMLVSRMSRRFMLLQSRSPQRPERQQTLRATLIWSWELLSAAEQSALAQCSVFEGGFSLEAAEAVIELDDDNCEDVIAELASKSLLTLRHGGPHQAVRLSMLLSVQQFVREQMHVMHPVEARHGQYFSRFGSPAAISALSLSATNRPHQALLAERDNLLAATHRAIARDDAIVAAQCALAAAEIYHQRGPILAGARLLEQVARSVTLPPLLNTRVQRTTGQLFLLTRYHANAAVCFQDALVAARAAGDREQEAMCLTQQASLSRVQGHLPQAEAHCLRALTIAREIGARMAEAHVLAQQGILCRHQGHMEDARTLLEAATEIAAEQGARKAGAGWMTILGQLDYDQGRLDDAQRWYEHALSIIRQLDNPGMESAASGHFSSLLRQQGRLEQAEDLLHDALRIAREIGNQRLEGYHLGRLGMLHFEQHRYEEAQQAYQVALTIAQQREERGEESLQHGRLGRLYHQQGRVEPAIAHYRAALEIAHQLNNRVGECNWLGNLGNLYFSINRYEEAEAVFLKAIAIARQTGDRGREGMWLGNLSNLYGLQGRYREAQAGFETALSIARDLNRRREEGWWVGGLGCVAFAQGRFPVARDLFEAALQIAAEVHERNQQGFWQSEIARTMMAQDQLKPAQERYEAALQIADDIQAPHLGGVCQRGLGNVHARLGHFAVARPFFERAEQQFRAIGESNELGMTMCHRAQLEAWDQRPQAGRRFLQQAQKIFAQHGQQSLPELAGLIEETAQILEAVEASPRVGASDSSRSRLG